MNRRAVFLLLLLGTFWGSGHLFAQFDTPNHPELQWYTIETEHFFVHYYPETERSARVAAKIAEEVYPAVTKLYHKELDTKVHLILKDTDDYSNGAAYYYDNKIIIWAMPLDFELRGSHNWLRDVITHEFTHIVQLNAAMKFSRKIPAVYFQWINEENEHRDDVVYGYPNSVVSYPIAGTAIPPWFAEGVAQYNVRSAPYDYWDSHRDMVLRDRVLHQKLLSWDEMNAFGKKGVGNESVYNQGFAFVSYLAQHFGNEVLYKITDAMTSPLAISFNNAIRRETGRSGRQLYRDWADSLHALYFSKTKQIRAQPEYFEILSGSSTGNFYPRWSPNDSLITYLSNNHHDYLSQTDLYLYNVASRKKKLIAPIATSGAAWAPDGSTVTYARRSEPTKYGSVYNDLYMYNLKNHKEERLTYNQRVKNPDWSPSDSLIVFVTPLDGTENLYYYDFTVDSVRQVTNYSNGEQIFSPRFSNDGKTIVFDMNTTFGRDIYQLDVESGELSVLLDNKWDVRSPVLRNDTLTFSDDRTGIYNIYQRDLSSGQEWALTNVSGSAFMPDFNQKGQLVLSLYDNTGYRLAFKKSPDTVKPEAMQYRNYAADIPFVTYNDSNFPAIQGSLYKNSYSHMFLVPRLMIEYGTVKPGLYFFSSEILDKMNVMGGFSINRLRDIDLYLSFDYNFFRPTLYTDLAIQTRNINQDIYIFTGDHEAQPGDPKTSADIRFTLMQTNFGIKDRFYRFPLGDLRWNLYGRYEQYSTFIKYLLSAKDTGLPDPLISKTRYEYYIGKQLHLDINWTPLEFRQTRLSYINPGTHFKTNIRYSYERNEFINDFTVTSSGLLQEVYTPNYYHKIEADLDVGLRLPFWKKSSLGLVSKAGWISKNDVDSFFDLFAGSEPGLRGYPYYSIEGTRLSTTTLQWRIPLVTEVNWRFIQLQFQDLYFGPYVQVGDAWKGGIDNIDWKTVIGSQLRVGGFSFYMYPTAITLDAAYGLNQFRSPNISDHQYGHEWRFYFTLLFEFDQ